MTKKRGKMTIITVANQKGGVGKTTTAMTLAHGLAMRGRSVLLIDLDSQGNCADALGLESAPALYKWLVGLEPIDRVVTRARERLDLIRSDKMTVQLKQALAGMDFREFRLADALDGYEYDDVVLDCPPSADILQTAALVAADLLVVPTRLDQFSVKGVHETLVSLASVKRATPSKCNLAGIIPTFYDQVTNESHAQLEALAGTFAGLIWPPIAVDTSCRVGSRKGLTIWEMMPRGRACVGYGECLEKLVKVI